MAMPVWCIDCGDSRANGVSRCAPELRAKILARYAERYPDFGPTLAAE